MEYVIKFARGALALRVQNHGGASVLASVLEYAPKFARDALVLSRQVLVTLMER